MKQMIAEDMTKIIIHSSATKPDQIVTVDVIREWHKRRGFDDIGYHYFIDRDGGEWPGRPLMYQGAHTYNEKTGTSYNNNIGVCLAGGLSYDEQPDFNFKFMQLSRLQDLVFRLRHKFPQIDVVCGHRDLDNTACPSFNVREYFK